MPQENDKSGPVFVYEISPELAARLIRDGNPGMSVVDAQHLEKPPEWVGDKGLPVPLVATPTAPTVAESLADIRTTLDRIEGHLAQRRHLEAVANAARALYLAHGDNGTEHVKRRVLGDALATLAAVKP
jgi:hypothetical protein